MVRAANQWPWSSYRATIGRADKPNWLNTNWLLASFGERKNQAIKSYKVLVSEGQGQPSPWLQLRNQVYLGSGKFMEQMQILIDGDKALSEIPSSQRRPAFKELSFYEKSTNSRNEAIVEAYLGGNYSHKEVGDYFGLHYSTVSSIVKNHKSKT